MTDEEEERLSLQLTLTLVLMNHSLGAIPRDQFEDLKARLWDHAAVRLALRTAREHVAHHKVIQFLDDMLFSPLSISPELRTLAASLREEV